MIRHIKYCLLVIALFIPFTAFASDFAKTVSGRISDYNFKEDECDIIVANRNALKQIALTFDDGPSPLYTAEILDILKEYDARATFFVIGENAKKYPELVLAEYTAGHEIGNHTYNHRNFRNLTSKQINEEIVRAQEIITEITGQAPILFRPPGGYLSNTIVDTINANNLRPVLWSWRQDTRDWAKPSVDSVVNSVIKNLSDGDIILFHDYNTKGSPTPEALRRLLPILKEKGYEFVTVSELVRV